MFYMYAKIYIKKRMPICRPSESIEQIERVKIRFWGLIDFLKNRVKNRFFEQSNFGVLSIYFFKSI